MKRALFAVVLLAGCGGGPSPDPTRLPSPTPTNTPEPAAITVKDERIYVTHVTDGRRRHAGNLLNGLPAGRALLATWDHDRVIHVFSTSGYLRWDVAFLTDTGKVLEVRPFQLGDEPGVTSSFEARHALFLPPGWVESKRLQAGDQVEFGVQVNTAKVAPMPQIRVGGHPIHIETAHQVEQRQRGLMHRPRMSDGDGMLFIYRYADERSFWMMNTFMALDIAFFREDGSLAVVRRTKPWADPKVDDGTRAASGEPVRFVLEVNYGWFDAHKLIDAEGKPAGKVMLELPAALRDLAEEAD